MADKFLLKIPVIAEGLTWMTVIGSIQLALRHPENNGPSSKIARQFAELLAGKLLAEGVLTDEEMAVMLRDEMVSQNFRPEAATLEAAIETAKRDLPEGWEVVLAISRGRMVVEIWDPDDCGGNTRVFLGPFESDPIRIVAAVQECSALAAARKL